MPEQRNQSLLAAGLLGAALGAAGAMAAIFLSNPDNRQKVQKQFGDLREEGLRKMNEASGQAKKLTDRLRTGVKETSEQYASEIKTRTPRRKSFSRRGPGRPRSK